MEQQSPDIALVVHGHLTKCPNEIGAGDQITCLATPKMRPHVLMSLNHVLASKLGACVTEVHKNGMCPWLKPDGKTQVTIEYYNDNGAIVPVRFQLFSSQLSMKKLLGSVLLQR